MSSSLFVSSVNPLQFGFGLLVRGRALSALWFFTGMLSQERCYLAVHINVSVDRWKEGDKLLEEILKPYASIVRPSLPHDLGK